MYRRDGRGRDEANTGGTLLRQGFGSWDGSERNERAFELGESLHYYPYSTIQYLQNNTIQFNSIQFNTIQQNTMQHNTRRYISIQSNTVCILNLEIRVYIACLSPKGCSICTYGKTGTRPGTRCEAGAIGNT
jgi:hypothetical protein